MEHPKPVEVIIKGIKVSQFFDKRFIELLERDMKETKFQHFCLYLTAKHDKNEEIVERISLSHQEPEDEIMGITNVDCDKPETLEKMLKVMEEFLR